MFLVQTSDYFPFLCQKPLGTAKGWERSAMNVNDNVIENELSWVVGSVSEERTASQYCFPPLNTKICKQRTNFPLNLGCHECDQGASHSQFVWL